MLAPFGWTVICEPWNRAGYRVYKRDCPATGLAQDLAPYTFTTKKQAIASGKNKHYAYSWRLKAYLERKDNLEQIKK